MTHSIDVLTEFLLVPSLTLLTRLSFFLFPLHREYSVLSLLLPIGGYLRESRGEHHHSETYIYSISACQSTRLHHRAPRLLRRKSATHLSSASIKASTDRYSPIFFQATLPTSTMLTCEQKPVIADHIVHNQSNSDEHSMFLTCAQLAAYITAMKQSLDRTSLIIDCGSPIRHSERRIDDSYSLNVNDRISRKRLSTRGLKHFLDDQQLNRLEKNDIVILYDDSIRSSCSCATSSIETQLTGSIKCVHDEIQRYNVNKTIYVLQSPFDDFYQQYPALCHVNTLNDRTQSLPTPETPKPTAIDMYEMSEILPGLYLGSATDASNSTLLKEHRIRTIVNISTSIPCYFENEKTLDYVQLPCHDSCHQDILQYFQATHQRIHQDLCSNKPVLVHCQAGVSRSPSFIIGYLMQYHQKSLEEAHRFVKDKRSIVNPNLHFLGQLMQYQRMLSGAQ